MRTLIISSCTGKKKFNFKDIPNCDTFFDGTLNKWEDKLSKYRIEAIEMYKGMQHQIVARCFKRLIDSVPKDEFNFYILSAAYGLIPYNKKIIPYNCTYNGMKVNKIKELGLKQNLKNEFYDITKDYDFIFVLLGRDYLKALALDTLPESPKFVFLGSKESKGLIPKKPNVIFIDSGNSKVKEYNAASIYLKGTIFEEICECYIDGKLDKLLEKIGTKFNGKLNNLSKLNELSGSEWIIKSKSVWRGIYTHPSEKTEHPAQFPISLIDKLLSVFTKENDVAYDPFLGSGSTLISCKKNNRNGFGIDLNERYINLSQKRLDEFIVSNNSIQLPILGDSRFASTNPKVKEFLNKLGKTSIDFMVTSPPYWDVLNSRHKKTVLSIEKQPKQYSSKIEDLGNLERYEDFLAGLKEVYTEVFTLLGDRKYCVINVMDIRKGDIVYPVHSDIIKLMNEIGYKYQDLIIWDRDQEYNFLRPMGYPTTFIINRIHEYLLIFRKLKK